jgi:hypothetical protein
LPVCFCLMLKKCSVLNLTSETIASRKLLKGLERCAGHPCRAWDTQTGNRKRVTGDRGQLPSLRKY